MIEGGTLVTQYLDAVFCENTGNTQIKLPFRCATMFTEGYVFLKLITFLMIEQVRWEVDRKTRQWLYRRNELQP